MVNDLGHVTLNFHAVPMYQLHAIQHDVVEEINKRERVIFGQLKTSKKIAPSLKKIVKETKNKENTWEVLIPRLCRCWNGVQGKQ